ncbi:hypothetical protein EV14_2998 [Prochlorococcus sp. MIT 0703]|uniref:hypothetical protein n=1 Tax=Prochlorococcus sp. MIT 0702 TaxID=1499503 RepID=UPI000533A437|nr:hypothetical protein EV12_3112 [Prochlorococcus sp. MIT 0701]KGG30065.1 hypothetical protein EV14_2998 [Prochlorococcus sp. MIT 0703]
MSDLLSVQPLCSVPSASLSLASAAALALANSPFQPVVAQDDDSPADLGAWR